MFKKIICAILIALMLVTVFVGCRNDKTDNGENEGGENEGGENNGGEGGEGNKEPNDNPQGLEFTLKADDTYMVSVGKATELSKIEIPATYKDKPVTELGKFAVTGSNGTSNTALNEIVIPDSITTIGTGAFTGCTAMTGVYITDLTKWCSITFGDFYANPLNYAKNLYVNGELVTDLVIPDGVTNLPNFVFYGLKSAVSITIPDSVETIGDNVFYGCSSMERLEIGSGVVSIGTSAFMNCGALVYVNITDVASWCGITFAGNASNPMFYANKLYLNGELLSELVIPEGVTTINSRAFFNCKPLTSVTLPSTLSLISEDAFLNCSKLVEVINHSALTVAPGDTFNGGVSLNAQTVHSGESLIENVDGYLFITLDGANYLLTYVGTDNELVLPANYKGESYAIYSNAFYYFKNLTSVIISDGVTAIGEYAFYNCNGISNLKIGKNVTVISGYAFSYCHKLTEVSVPDSVTELGTYAFVSCINIQKLELGKNVTKIGDKAFANCAAMTGVYITDFEKWCQIEFATYDSNPLYGAKKLFVNGELLTELIIPTSVTKIGNNAFINCTALTRVIIHDGVTGIGEFAFYGCLNVTSVKVGAGVTAINNAAFDGCYRLAEVINFSSLGIAAGSAENGKIGANAVSVHSGESRITEIDGYLFYAYGNDCYLLGYSGNETALVLPENCNGSDYAIYKQAFLYYDQIESIVFSNGVTGVYENAFVGCSALTSVTISPSVTFFGTDAFLGCSDLIYVNVTDIAKWCAISFANDRANPVTTAKRMYVNGELLTKLVVPEGVTFISSQAFHGCDCITSVTLPSTLTSIGSNAFVYCYKLVEVINNSSLTVKCGNMSYGYVAKYAKEIHTGESKVDVVGDYIFYTCEGVNYLIYYKGDETELVFPESYKGQGYAIADYFFLDNKLVTSIVIPDCVTAIGMNAFRFCEKLETVVIGSGVKNIASGAFYACNALTSLTIENTSGWKADKTSITSAELTDTANAAKLFSVTYNNVAWKCSK